MMLTYNQYRLFPVYGRVDEPLRREIFEFWMRNAAIQDANEAWRRTDEVVFVIRNAADEIVGIASVYVGESKTKRRFYFYRMFMRPGDRVFKLAHFALLATRDFLQHLEAADKPHGLVIVAENPKLMRKGMQKFFQANGFAYAGRTPAGLGIWKYDFGSES